MVYTKSKLDSLLKGRPCESDNDCKIGDCEARCTSNMVCSSRSNGNLEVSLKVEKVWKNCEKSIKSAKNELFSRWPNFS